MAVQVGSFSIPITMETDWNDWDEKYNEGMSKIKLKVLEHNPNGGPLVGREIRFSVTDGYAHYVIVRESPLQLAFVDVDGGLKLPDDKLKKLQLKDVQKMIDRLDAVNHKLYPWVNTG